MTLSNTREPFYVPGVIGTIIGAIPGVGEDIAAWVSYDFARRASKEKELFGRGSKEGLLAAETGNNACVPGAMIPVLSLAVPGSAPAAVLLAAMFIHGVRPGPLIMIEFPDFIYQVVAMTLACDRCHVRSWPLNGQSPRQGSHHSKGKDDAFCLCPVCNRLVRNSKPYV